MVCVYHIFFIILFFMFKIQDLFYQGKYKAKDVLHGKRPLYGKLTYKEFGAIITIAVIYNFVLMDFFKGRE